MKKEYNVGMKIALDLPNEFVIEVVEEDDGENTLGIKHEGQDFFNLDIIPIDNERRQRLLEVTEENEGKGYTYNSKTQFLYFEDFMLFFSLINFRMLYKLNNGTYLEFNTLLNDGDPDLDSHLFEAVRNMLYIANHCEINGEVVSVGDIHANELIRKLV